MLTVAGGLIQHSGVSSDVDKVAAIYANVTKVANIDSDVTTVAGIDPILQMLLLMQRIQSQVAG